MSAGLQQGCRQRRSVTQPAARKCCPALCCCRCHPKPHADCNAGLIRVQPNDLCYKIAAAQGITLEQLQEANPGLDCLNLFIGQYLCIPGELRLLCLRQFCRAAIGKIYSSQQQQPPAAKAAATRWLCQIDVGAAAMAIL